MKAYAPPRFAQVGMFSQLRKYIVRSANHFRKFRSRQCCHSQCNRQMSLGTRFGDCGWEMGMVAKDMQHGSFSLGYI